MMTAKTDYDVVVVGAGAAGMMTAVAAARGGARVLLVDGKDQVGAKILMSGGTRCNLTNVVVKARDYASEHPQLVARVLASFPSARALEFFQELGVETEAEPDGKYFPVTHSGKTVLEAFLRELGRLKVPLMTGCKAAEIVKDGDHFVIRGRNFEESSRSVVIATGGLSYPSTGSDGSGYALALALGHSVIETTPALTPLLTHDRDWTALSGLALPSVLTLSSGGKKVISFSGPLLFTHFGFSGPAVLDISRYWLRCADRPRLTADFLPNGELSEEDLVESARSQGRKTLKGFLAQFLPENFIIVLLKKLGLEPQLILSQLKAAQRRELVQAVHGFPLPAHSVLGYAKAEATAGGVDLAQVDVRTMESKLHPGLFFAGEVLDVDGRIGGFNFQWAWSSGYLAATGALMHLRNPNGDPGESAG